MDNYEAGIYTDNPDDTLRYVQTTVPVDLWGNPKLADDYVLVVRCKDCKHAQYDRIFDWYYCNEATHDKNFFCADGERRSE